MNALVIDGIGKRFGDRQVLDSLSLSVMRGEVYGLLGPNGCGKSTVMNIVCGLLPADAGRIELRGSSVGLCPQDSALYRDLLPAENLDFFARLHGLKRDQRRQRVDELMSRFALQPYAKTPVGQLSSGWQQRLNLAVALVHEPDLLILDEPTAAVDLEARQALWTLIESLRDSGMGILLSTHQLDEAERLCTRVGLMQGGRIAAEGLPTELIARVPAQAVAVLQTVDECAVQRRAADLGWLTRRYAEQLACLLPHALSMREVAEALDGLPLTSISVQPVSLQHAYLEVMGSLVSAPSSPRLAP